MYCGSCGQNMGASMKFCIKCGAKVVALTGPDQTAVEQESRQTTAEQLEKIYGRTDAPREPVESGGATAANSSGWKWGAWIGGIAVALVLVWVFMHPVDSGVVLDSTTVEQLIVDDAASGGFEIFVECPAVMIGELGDTWLCEASDRWGFSGPVEVTLEDNDGWVTWEYLF